MRDHNELRAYQLADEVALLTYKLTSEFPKHEIYGLTSQMRRAGVSVASNIVEGCARETKREYVRFLVIAYASLKELQYQQTLARRLEYIKEIYQNKFEQKLTETEKVLSALIRKLRNPEKPPPSP
ncbi:MAG: four helix bundle protein [Bacteroidales bacterium]|nr:four helix bundle protein [Bacteroidales bacterium]